MCIFSMFISGRMHIKDSLYAGRVLMNFFNVFISLKDGLGGSLMHVYVWEHIASLQSRLMDVDQTWWG